MRDLAKLEEEEKIHKVTNLRVITGGKEPPSTGDTWLEKMEVGSCFLVKEVNNPLNYNLGLFRVDSKTNKAVILVTPSISHTIPVDPIPFCNKYRLYEDLGIILTTKEMEEHDSNRPKVSDGDETNQME